MRQIENIPVVPVLLNLLSIFTNYRHELTLYQPKNYI